MAKSQQRVYNTYQIKKDFEKVDRIAHIMDNKYELFGFRFGLDPLLNLVPYVGDIIGFVVGTYLVVIMAKNGVSTKVIIKMFLNVVADLIIGGIPIIGKVADFFFKGNQRNVDLLKSHYYEGTNHGSGIGIIITILVVFFVVIALIIWLLWVIASTVFGWISALF